MRTIAFILAGLICFITISWLLSTGALPLGWYLALCFAGMVLVAIVLRWRLDTFGSSIKTLEEE